MNRYPQCARCKLNKNGICQHDKKPIKAKAMNFASCRYAKFKEAHNVDNKTEP